MKNLTKKKVTKRDPPAAQTEQIAFDVETEETDNEMSKYMTLEKGQTPTKPKGMTKFELRALLVNYIRMPRHAKTKNEMNKKFIQETNKYLINTSYYGRHEKDKRKAGGIAEWFFRFEKVGLVIK